MDTTFAVEHRITCLQCLVEGERRSFWPQCWQELVELHLKQHWHHSATPRITIMHCCAEEQTARKLKLTCEGWICKCPQVKICEGSRTLCKFLLTNAVVAKGATRKSMFKKLAPDVQSISAKRPFFLTCLHTQQRNSYSPICSLVPSSE